MYTRNRKLHFEHFHQDEMRSVQLIVIDSNSPLIIGLKTSEDLNLLKRLSNINVNNNIDFCVEYADYFGKKGLLKNQYKIQLKSDAQSVIHAPRRVPIAFKDNLRNELDRMKRLDIIEEVPISEFLNGLIL